MADIPTWLKNFRTPNLSSAPSFERPSYTEDANDNEDGPTRPRNVRRVSSYLTITRSKTPSVSSGNPPAHLSHAEEVWHNPDETQVVETLKVLLMTNSTFEPIPVQYNSCVLQVLEAYRNIRDALKEKAEELKAIDINRLKREEEFEEERLQWKAKEKDYKKEIKNLEVTLATGARGLDLVTMARSKSVVYKATGESWDEEAVERARRDGNFATAEKWTVDYCAKKDRQTSQRFNSRQHARNDRNYNSEERMQQSRRSETLHDTKSSHGGTSRGYRIQHWRETNTNESGYQQLREHTSMSSTSPSIDDDSSEDARPTYSPGDIEDCQRKATSFIADHKPLPELPAGSLESKSKDLRGAVIDDSQRNQNENASTQPDIRKRGFSFEPGDDYGTMPMDSTTRRTVAFGLGIIPHGDSRFSTKANSWGGKVDTETKHDKKAHRPEKTLVSQPAALNEPSLSSNRKRNVEGLPSLDRSHNSQSSIVTAIRDNSGRSNQGPPSRERHAPEAGKSQPVQHGGSNEATIAAVRAIAGNEKRAP